MRATYELADYLAAPRGSALIGPTFIVWWRSAALNGIVFWGRPEEKQVEAVTRALDAELGADVTRHASLIDARRVDAVDLAAFNRLSSYVRRRGETFARLITKQALLRPEGFAGAAVAGFYAILEPRYPVSVFTNPDDALAWLDVAREAALIEELEQLVASARADSPLLASLREYLQRQPSGATLHSVAAELGVSARSLQRKLREANTSFRREEREAQVRAARALLLDTELDVKQVASVVGCASVQHFTTLFRKWTGETPSRWRTARRERREDAA